MKPIDRIYKYTTKRETLILTTSHNRLNINEITGHVRHTSRFTALVVIKFFGVGIFAIFLLDNVNGALEGSETQIKTVSV